MKNNRVTIAENHRKITPTLFRPVSALYFERQDNPPANNRLPLERNVYVIMLTEVGANECGRRTCPNVRFTAFPVYTKKNHGRGVAGMFPAFAIASRIPVSAWMFLSR